MDREGSPDTPQDGQGLLPGEGIKALADRLTEYMTQIGLVDMPEVMEQVLDDVLVQCGGIPDDLDDPETFDRIVNLQLAVTLAFQLGRLEGRAPQIVESLIQEAFQEWDALELDAETEITVEDFANVAERVLPKLRRWRYFLDRG